MKPITRVNPGQPHEQQQKMKNFKSIRFQKDTLFFLLHLFFLDLTQTHNFEGWTRVNTRTTSLALWLRTQNACFTPAMHRLITRQGLFPRARFVLDSTPPPHLLCTPAIHPTLSLSLAQHRHTKHRHPPKNITTPPNQTKPVHMHNTTNVKKE